MKYSLDKIHKQKDFRERGNGKTVDAVMNVIGLIMVTENKQIPFILEKIDWIRHVENFFVDICLNHFNVKPIKHQQLIWRIEGYTSHTRIYSLDDYLKDKVRGNVVAPIFDVYHDTYADIDKIFESYKKKPKHDNSNIDDIQYNNKIIKWKKNF